MQRLARPSSPSSAGIQTRMNAGVSMSEDALTDVVRALLAGTASSSTAAGTSTATSPSSCLNGGDADDKYGGGGGYPPIHKVDALGNPLPSPSSSSSQFRYTLTSSSSSSNPSVAALLHRKKLRDQQQATLPSPALIVVGNPEKKPSSATNFSNPFASKRIVAATGGGGDGSGDDPSPILSSVSLFRNKKDSTLPTASSVASANTLAITARNNPHHHEGEVDTINTSSSRGAGERAWLAEEAYINAFAHQQRATSAACDDKKKNHYNDGNGNGSQTTTTPISFATPERGSRPQTDMAKTSAAPTAAAQHHRDLLHQLSPHEKSNVILKLLEETRVKFASPHAAAAQQKQNDGHDDTLEDGKNNKRKTASSSVLDTFTMIHPTRRNQQQQHGNNNNTSTLHVVDASGLVSDTSLFLQREIDNVIRDARSRNGKGDVVGDILQLHVNNNGNTFNGGGEEEGGEEENEEYDLGSPLPKRVDGDGEGKEEEDDEWRRDNQQTNAMLKAMVGSGGVGGTLTSVSPQPVDPAAQHTRTNNHLLRHFANDTLPPSAVQNALGLGHHHPQYYAAHHHHNNDPHHAYNPPAPVTATAAAGGVSPLPAHPPPPPPPRTETGMVGSPPRNPTASSSSAAGGSVGTGTSYFYNFVQQPLSLEPIEKDDENDYFTTASATNDGNNCRYGWQGKGAAALPLAIDNKKSPSPSRTIIGGSVLVGDAANTNSQHQHQQQQRCLSPSAVARLRSNYGGGKIGPSFTTRGKNGGGGDGMMMVSEEKRQHWLTDLQGGEDAPMMMMTMRGGDNSNNNGAVPLLLSSPPPPARPAPQPPMPSPSYSASVAANILLEQRAKRTDTLISSSVNAYRQHDHPLSVGRQLRYSSSSCRDQPPLHHHHGQHAYSSTAATTSRNYAAMSSPSRMMYDSTKITSSNRGGDGDAAMLRVSTLYNYATTTTTKAATASAASSSTGLMAMAAASSGLKKSSVSQPTTDHKGYGPSLFDAVAGMERL